MTETRVRAESSTAPRGTDPSNVWLAPGVSIRFSTSSLGTPSGSTSISLITASAASALRAETSSSILPTSVSRTRNSAPPVSFGRPTVTLRSVLLSINSYLSEGDSSTCMVCGVSR